MNRKIKWLCILLASGILFGLATIPLRISSMIYNLNRYIPVPYGLLAYANVLLLQGIFFILLAILIPLLIYIREEPKTL